MPRRDDRGGASAVPPVTSGRGREEADRAPGLLRRITRITDPDHAVEHDPRFAGMPAGAEPTHEEVVRVAVVPDADTLP